MIHDFRPDFVVLDSFTAFDPEIESRNSRATQVMLKLRGIIRETGSAIVGTHHLSKPSTRNDKTPPSLEKCKVRDWFFQARGASALINTTDVRIGVEEPLQGTSVETGGEEVVLVMRGFARINGEIPPIYIARVFNENGEPVGYNDVTGPRLLFNPDQEAAYNKLPAEFRFKAARLAYGRGSQATSDFLKKCQGLKIVRKKGHWYSKTKTFWAFDHGKFDPRSIVQSFVTFSDYSAVVDEHVVAVGSGNKSEGFQVVEEFHGPISLGAGGAGEADEFGSAGIDLRGVGVDIAATY